MATTDEQGVPEELGRRAREASARGDAGEAEELLVRAVDLAPGDPRYPAALAAVFLRGGRHGLAAAYAELAAALAPGEGRYRRVLGAVWEAAGEGALARDAYLRAARDDPGDARSWLALARLGREEGRYGEAEGHAHRAVSLSPGGTGALIELGAILGLAGRPAEAEEILRRAVAGAPGDAAALCALGAAQAGSGRLREAEATLGRALTAAPDGPASLELGRVRRALGDRAGAEALLRRAQARPGADPRTTRRLFDAPLGAGAPPAATPGRADPGREGPSLAELEARVGAGGADPSAYARLGAALVRAGRTREGLAAAREAERLRGERRGGARLAAGGPPP